MTRQSTAPPEPNIIVQQQRRKSMAMRVTPAGDVLVLIPRWLRRGDRRVKRFIEQGLVKLSAYIPAHRPQPLHTPADIRRLVAEWALRLDVKPGRVQLRPMTRKWGSCSSRGSITLNTALVYLPPHLVEYVVVHELAHMIVFDHSPAFWALVGEHVPDYEACRRELESCRV
jgi:predicted metal-dependent hydrolase